jgi:hypothetical protein
LGKIVKAQGWAGRLAYIKGQFCKVAALKGLHMGQERGGLVEAVGRVTKLMRRNLLGPEKAYFVLFFSSGEGRESQAHDIKLAKIFENGIIEQNIYKKYTNK